MWDMHVTTNSYCCFNSAENEHFGKGCIELLLEVPNYSNHKRAIGIYAPHRVILCITFRMQMWKTKQEHPGLVTASLGLWSIKIVANCNFLIWLSVWRLVYNIWTKPKESNSVTIKYNWMSLFLHPRKDGRRLGARLQVTGKGRACPEVHICHVFHCGNLIGWSNGAARAAGISNFWTELRMDANSRQVRDLKNNHYLQSIYYIYIFLFRSNLTRPSVSLLNGV